MAKKRILVFGNEHVASDSLAVEVGRMIASTRKDIEVIECKNPDDIIEFYSGKDCFILDVAEGIKEVTLLDDPSLLSRKGPSTLHDFDLGFFLLLVEKLGLMDKIRIICLPMGEDAKEMAKIVKGLL